MLRSFVHVDEEALRRAGTVLAAAAGVARFVPRAGLPSELVLSGAAGGLLLLAHLGSTSWRPRPQWRTVGLTAWCLAHTASCLFVPLSDPVAAGLGWVQLLLAAVTGGALVYCPVPSRGRLPGPYQHIGTASVNVPSAGSAQPSPGSPLPGGPQVDLWR